MKTYTSEDFKAWGAQGGAKSKRVLTAAQAKAMVAAREKKRRKTKRVTRRANSLPHSPHSRVRGDSSHMWLQGSY